MALEVLFIYNEVDSETVDPGREECNGTPGLLQDKSGHRHKQASSWQEHIVKPGGIILMETHENVDT